MQLYEADINECTAVLEQFAIYAPQNFAAMYTLAKAEYTRVFQSNVR